MELTLVRHTSVQAEGLCYGHYDVALADTFAAEMEAVRAQLQGKTFDAIYCSPSKRCRLLAEALGYADVRYDDRLRELHFGDWENRAWNSIAEADMAPWMADWVRQAPPGGESLEALFSRVKNFLEAVQSGGAERVLVVTHSGVVRCVRAYVEGVALDRIFEWKVGFGEVRVVRVPAL